MHNFFSHITKSTKKIKKTFSSLISHQHSDIFLFLSSCLIIILIKCIQFPSLTIHAEMFAENGSDFFIRALQDNFVTAVFTPDAGYLPLFQRIISLVLVKGLHLVAWYPFVSQLIAIVFIAVMSSLFNLKIFKTLCQSTVIRFMLGISLGLISDYELNAFINFIYYGAIFLFFMIFVNKEKLKNLSFFFLTLFSSLIILSKGQFVIFIPIYLVIAYLHKKKKQFKSLRYYLFGIAAGLVQLIFTYFHTTKSTEHKSILLLPYYLIKTIYYYFLTYRHVFIGYLTKEHNNYFGLVLLIFLFIFALKKLIKNKEKTLLYFFLVGNFIAFCSLFLTVTVLNNSVNPQLKNVYKTITVSKPTNIVTPLIKQTSVKKSSYKTSIFDDKHLANLRSLFISNFLIFLTGILVLISLFSRTSEKIIIAVIFIYASGSFGQIKVEENYPKQFLSYSQWGTYSHLLEKSQYCIPLNHYPFLLAKNCDYLLYQDPNFTPAGIANSTNIKLTQSAKNWQIQAVILVNKTNQSLDNHSLTVYAYDQNDLIIGRGTQLVPNNYQYIYFLFPQPVSAVKKLEWKTINGTTVKINPTIIIFGIRKNR